MQLTEETHHKMSKKIAQLTKVIFHLHTKNEENAGMQTAIQNAYEKEIETLLSQANSVIVKQKEAIQKAQEAQNIKEKFKQLEAQHVAEKEASVAEFKAYKTQVAEKERKTDEEHGKKLQEFRTQVMDIKAGFDTRVQEFKKQIDDFRKNNEAIDALKKAHAAEMAAHVQESNRKYNDLLAEKLNSEDALRQKAEKDIATLTKEWQIKLNDIVKKARAEEQEAAAAKAKIVKETHDEEVASLRAMILELQAQVKLGLEKVAQKDAVIQTKEQAIADKDGRIVSLESEVKRLNNLINQNGLEASELATRLAQSQKACTDLEERIRKLTAELAAANQKCSKLEDEVMKLKTQLQATQGSLQDQLGQKTLENELLLRKISDLEQLLKQTSQEAQVEQTRLKSEIKKLSEEIRSLHEQIKMLKANAGDQVQQLQDQLQRLLEEHKRAIAAMEIDFAKERAEMKAELVQELSALKETHERACIQLSNQKEAEKEKQRHELQQIIDELKQQLDEEKKKMGEAGKQREKQLLQEIESLKKQLDDKDKYIATLAKTIANLENEVRARDRAIEGHLATIASLEDKIRQLEGRLSQAMESGDQETKNLRKQLSQLQSEFESYKQKAKLEFSQMQESLTQQHVLQMDELRRKYEQMIAEMQANASNDKEFIQNELRKKIMALERQIDELKREHGDEKSKMMKHHHETVLGLGDTIEKLKGDHSKQIADIKLENERQLTNLKRQHEEAITALKRALSSDQQAALEELRKQHAAEIARLNEKHELHCRDLNAGFEKRVAQIESENAREMKRVQEAHSAEVAKREGLISELKARIQDLLLQLEEMEKAKQGVETQLKYTESLIAGMEDKVKEAQARTERSLKEHQEKSVKLERDFISKEQRLQKNLKATLEQMMSDQAAELSALQEEFGNASQLMDNKYAMLNDNFKELEALYQSRPSRPEDLDLVKQLQDDVLAKEQALKKAAEDMKFYKLELINREQSYNTMFGTNPNVGLMNPLGVKSSVGAKQMISQKDIGKKQRV